MRYLESCNGLLGVFLRPGVALRSLSYAIFMPCPLIASILQDASFGANFSLGKMATLDPWLIANVGTEERRDEVGAVVESLDDLRWLCDDMLSEHLNLEAWAPVARERFLNYHDFIPYAPPPCEELFVTRPFATFHVLEMTWKRLGWVGVQYHPEGTEEGVDWLIAGMCGTRYSHGHRFEALQLRCSLSLARRICGPLPD